jgi:hypothetical protein
MQEIFTKLYILFVMNTINVTQYSKYQFSLCAECRWAKIDQISIDKQIIPIQLVEEINTSQALQENIFLHQYRPMWLLFSCWCLSSRIYLIAPSPHTHTHTFVENDEFSEILTYKRAKNSLFECKWGGGGCQKFESFVGNLEGFAPSHRKKWISPTACKQCYSDCWNFRTILRDTNN